MLRSACAASSIRTTVCGVDRANGESPTPWVDGGNTVCFSHFPTQILLNEGAHEGAPTVVFLDDPVDSVRYMMAAGDYSPVDGIRFQGASLAGYAYLSECPNLLVIHRAIGSAKTLLDAVLAHLSLEFPAERRKEIVEMYFGPEGESASLETALKFYVTLYERPELAKDRMSSEDSAIVAQILTPLVQMVYSREPVLIVWPTKVFFSGDHPELPAPRWTDITGAARLLYYGPYFHLPAGLWQVRLLLAFSREACKLPFSAEVASTEILAQVTMKCDAKGVYEGTFEFENPSAFKPLEIRIRIDRGAIDGFFALGRAELRRAERAEVAPRSVPAVDLEFPPARLPR